LDDNSHKHHKLSGISRKIWIKSSPNNEDGIVRIVSKIRRTLITLTVVNEAVKPLKDARGDRNRRQDDQAESRPHRKEITTDGHFGRTDALHPGLEKPPVSSAGDEIEAHILRLASLLAGASQDHPYYQAGLSLDDVSPAALPT
jgi:hypothetical protein